MDFAEFQKMLLKSLRDNSVKNELMSLLSEDNVSKQIDEYVAKIKELEGKIAESSNDEKYEKLLAEYNDLSGTSAAVKLELAEKNKAIEEKTKTIEELNESIKNINSNGSDTEKIAADRIERLNKELKEIKSAASEKEAKISELTANLTSLQAQLDANSAANEDMKKQLESSDSDKNAEIGRLTEKITELTKIAEEAKSSLTQKDDAVKAAFAEIEKINADKSELTDKLKEAENRASSVEEAAAAKNAQLQKNIADMDVKIVSYVSEIDNIKSEVAQKNKLIDELKSANESKSSELKNKLESLSNEIADFKNKNDKLTTEIATYKSTAENSAAKISDLTSRLAEADENLSHKDATISSMNTQLQGMLVLRQKINEYAETANAYAEEVENARIILADRENTINSLNSQIAELTSKVDQYSEALATKNSQIDEIGKYAESLKNHAEDLSAQILERNAEISRKTSENESLLKDIQAYNLTFGDLTKMFEKFQNLAPSTKDGLKDVFTESLNVRSFLSSGAQWGHIQALWEYTQQKINAEDFTDVVTLNEIFEYFLDFHNSSYPSPLYALLDTKTGDTFDEDQHTKIMSREERKAAFFADKKKGGSVDGIIKEVVLCGYKNLRNGRVLKPSIVRV